MHKLLLLIAVLTALHACSNLGSNTTAKKSGEHAELPQTGPDASDLLLTLQGRWQNQQDLSNVLEVTDTRMRHFTNGSLIAETEVEIDGSCQTTPCKMDSTDLTDGWCFIEKGQFDAQCYIIVSCDKEYLKYNAIGVENGLLVFKKL